MSTIIAELEEPQTSVELKESAELKETYDIPKAPPFAFIGLKPLDPENMNINLFSNIHNDAWLRGTTLQGGYIIYSTAYILKTLEFLVNDTENTCGIDLKRKAEIQTLFKQTKAAFDGISEIQKLIQKLFKRQKNHEQGIFEAEEESDLNEDEVLLEAQPKKEEATNENEKETKSNKENELFKTKQKKYGFDLNDEIAKIALKIIKILKRSGDICFPIEWSGTIEMPYGHSMVGRFIRNNDGTLNFLIYNTGGGLEYHLENPQDDSLRLPVMAYHIPMCKDQDLQNYIQELLAPAIKSELRYKFKIYERSHYTYTPQVIYETIIPKIQAINGKKIDPTVFCKKYIKGQSSGTCATRIALHLLMLLMSNENEQNEQKKSDEKIRSETIQNEILSTEAFQEELLFVKIFSIIDFYHNLKRKEKTAIGTPGVQKTSIQQLQIALSKFSNYVLRLMSRQNQKILFLSEQRLESILEGINEIEIEIKRMLHNIEEKQKENAIELIEHSEEDVKENLDTSFEIQSSDAFIVDNEYPNKNECVSEKETKTFSEADELQENEARKREAHKKELEQQLQQLMPARDQNESLACYLKKCYEIIKYNKKNGFILGCLHDIEELYKNIPLSSGSNFWVIPSKMEIRECFELLQKITHIYGNQCMLSGSEPLPQRMVTFLTGMLCSKKLLAQYIESNEKYKGLCDSSHISSGFKKPFRVTLDLEFDLRMEEVIAEVEGGSKCSPDPLEIFLMKKYQLTEILDNVHHHQHARSLDYPYRNARLNLFKILKGELKPSFSTQVQENFDKLKDEFSFALHVGKFYQECLLVFYPAFGYFEQHDGISQANPITDGTRLKNIWYAEDEPNRYNHLYSYRFGYNIESHFSSHGNKLEFFFNIEDPLVRDLLHSFASGWNSNCPDLNSNQIVLKYTKFIEQHKNRSLLYRTLPFLLPNKAVEDTIIPNTIDLIEGDFSLLNEVDVQLLPFLNLMNSELFRKQLSLTPSLPLIIFKSIKENLRKYIQDDKIEPAGFFSLKVFLLLFEKLRKIDVKAGIEPYFSEFTEIRDLLSSRIQHCRLIKESAGNTQERRNLAIEQLKYLLNLDILRLNLSFELNKGMSEEEMIHYLTSLLDLNLIHIQSTKTLDPLTKNKINTTIQKLRKFIDKTVKDLSQEAQEVLIKKLIQRSELNNTIKKSEYTMIIHFPLVRLLLKDNDNTTINLDLTNGTVKSSSYLVGIMPSNFYTNEFTNFFGNIRILDSKHKLIDRYSECLFDWQGKHWRIILEKTDKCGSMNTITHIQVQFESTKEWYELTNKKQIASNLPEHFTENNRYNFVSVKPPHRDYLITNENGHPLINVVSDKVFEIDREGNPTGYQLINNINSAGKFIKKLETILSKVELPNFTEIWYHPEKLSEKYKVKLPRYLNLEFSYKNGPNDQGYFEWVNNNKFKLLMQDLKVIDGFSTVLYLENKEDPKDRIAIIPKQECCVGDDKDVHYRLYFADQAELAKSILQAINPFILRERVQAWQFTGTCNYSIFPVVERESLRNLLPSIRAKKPKEYLHLAYIYLVTRRTEMAMELLRECASKGGLEGEQEEIVWIKRIMTEIPNPYVNTEIVKKAITFEPETLCVRLMAGLLLCRAKPISLTKPMLSGYGSRENYDVALFRYEKLIEFYKNYNQPTGVLVSIYRDYDKVSKLVPSDMALSYTEELSLLRVIFYKAKPPYLGFMAERWRKLELRSLSCERRALINERSRKGQLTERENEELEKMNRILSQGKSYSITSTSYISENVKLTPENPWDVYLGLNKEEQNCIQRAVYYTYYQQYLSENLPQEKLFSVYVPQFDFLYNFQYFYTLASEPLTENNKDLKAKLKHFLETLATIQLQNADDYKRFYTQYSQILKMQGINDPTIALYLESTLKKNANPIYRLSTFLLYVLHYPNGHKFTQSEYPKEVQTCNWPFLHNDFSYYFTEAFKRILDTAYKQTLLFAEKYPITLPIVASQLNTREFQRKLRRKLIVHPTNHLHDKLEQLIPQFIEEKTLVEFLQLETLQNETQNIKLESFAMPDIFADYVTNDSYIAAQIKLFNEDLKEGALHNRQERVKRKIYQEYFSDDNQRQKIFVALAGENSISGAIQKAQLVLKDLEIKILELANRAITGSKTALSTKIRMKAQKIKPLELTDVRRLYLQRDPVLFQKRMCSGFKEAQECYQLYYQYLIEKTQLQQKERVLKILNDLKGLNPKQPEFGILLIMLGKEITAIRNYNTSLHPEFLITEEDDSILMTLIQVKELKRFFKRGDNGGFRNNLSQIKMGGGKSRVIGPNIAKHHADGRNLVLYEFPSASFNSGSKDLQKTIYRKFGQRAHAFSFTRDQEDFNAAWLKRKFNEFRDISRDRDIVTTVPESMQALELKYFELLFSESKKESEVERINAEIRYLEKIDDLTEERGDGFLDEVDSGFHIKKELNFEMGEELPVNNEFLKTILEIYELFPETAFSVFSDKKITLEEVMLGECFLTNDDDWDKALASLVTNIVDHDKGSLKRNIITIQKDNICDSVANNTEKDEKTRKENDGTTENVQNKENSTDTPKKENKDKRIELTVEQQNELKKYLLGKTELIPNFVLNIDSLELRNKIGVIKAQIYFLRSILQKVLNVDMGLPLDLSKSVDMELARPYIASNMPNYRAEFGTFYESAGYTIRAQTDPKKIISAQIILAFIKKFKERASAEEMGNGIKFEETAAAKEFFSLTEMHLFDVDIENQIELQELQLELSNNKKAKQYILLHFILSRIKYHPLVLTSGPVNHAGQLRSFQGASGSMEMASALHIRLEYDPELAKGTKGQIIDDLITSKAPVLILRDKKPFAVLEYCYKSLPEHKRRNLHSFINVGALFEEVPSNEIVAREFARFFAGLPEEESDIQLILYFNQAGVFCGLPIVRPNIIKEPIIIGATDPKTILEMTGCHPKSCFIYYPQLQTRNIDVTQPKGSVGVISARAGLETQDYTQGVMRLRGFGDSQELITVIDKVTADSFPNQKWDQIQIIKMAELNQIKKIGDYNYQGAIQNMREVIRKHLKSLIKKERDFTKKRKLYNAFFDAFFLRVGGSPFEDHKEVEVPVLLETALQKMRNNLLLFWECMLNNAKLVMPEMATTVDNDRVMIQSKLNMIVEIFKNRSFDKVKVLSTGQVKRNESEVVIVETVDAQKELKKDREKHQEGVDVIIENSSSEKELKQKKEQPKESAEITVEKLEAQKELNKDKEKHKEKEKDHEIAVEHPLPPTLAAVNMNAKAITPARNIIAGWNEGSYWNLTCIYRLNEMLPSIEKEYKWKFDDNVLVTGTYRNTYYNSQDIGTSFRGTLDNLMKPVHAFLIIRDPIIHAMKDSTHLNSFKVLLMALEEVPCYSEYISSVKAKNLLGNKEEACDIWLCTPQGFMINCTREEIDDPGFRRAVDQMLFLQMNFERFTKNPSSSSWLLEKLEDKLQFLESLPTDRNLGKQIASLRFAIKYHDFLRELYQLILTNENKALFEKLEEVSNLYKKDQKKVLNFVDKEGLSLLTCALKNHNLTAFELLFHCYSRILDKNDLQIHKDIVLDYILNHKESNHWNIYIELLFDRLQMFPRTLKQFTIFLSKFISVINETRVKSLVDLASNNLSRNDFNAVLQQAFKEIILMTKSQKLMDVLLTHAVIAGLLPISENASDWENMWEPLFKNWPIILTQVIEVLARSDNKIMRELLQGAQIDGKPLSYHLLVLDDFSSLEKVKRPCKDKTGKTIVHWGFERSNFDLVFKLFQQKWFQEVLETDFNQEERGKLICQLINEGVSKKIDFQERNEMVIKLCIAGFINGWDYQSIEYCLNKVPMLNEKQLHEIFYVAIKASHITGFHKLLEKTRKELDKGKFKYILNEISETINHPRSEVNLQIVTLVTSVLRELSLEEEKIRQEEAERKRQEEAEKKRYEEAERKRQEEAERKNQEEAERRRQEEAERKKQEAAEKIKQAETERKRQEEAERRRQEEAEMKLELEKKFELEKKLALDRQNAALAQAQAAQKLSNPASGKNSGVEKSVAKNPSIKTPNTFLPGYDAVKSKISRPRTAPVVKSRKLDDKKKNIDNKSQVKNSASGGNLSISSHSAVSSPSKSPVSSISSNASKSLISSTPTTIVKKIVSRPHSSGSSIPQTSSDTKISKDTSPSVQKLPKKSSGASAHNPSQGAKVPKSFQHIQRKHVAKSSSSAVAKPSSNPGVSNGSTATYSSTYVARIKSASNLRRSSRPSNNPSSISGANVAKAPAKVKTTAGSSSTSASPSSTATHIASRPKSAGDLKNSSSVPAANGANTIANTQRSNV